MTVCAEVDSKVRLATSSCNIFYYNVAYMMMTKTNKNTNKRDRKEGEAWSEEEGRAKCLKKML